MKTSTETLVKAMHMLANGIQSDDGVANAAIYEAAMRLEEQEQHIKRLEEAGDRMDKTAEPFVLDSIDDDSDDGPIPMSDVGEQYEITYDSPPTAGDHVAMERARKQWRKAKEAKP